MGAIGGIIRTLQENFENATSLLVDKTRDTLDTTTASKTTNGGLGDSLDVVTQDLAMTFGTTPRKDKKVSTLGRRLGTGRARGTTTPKASLMHVCVILTFQDPFHLCRGQTLLIGENGLLEKWNGVTKSK